MCTYDVNKTLRRTETSHVTFERLRGDERVERARVEKWQPEEPVDVEWELDRGASVPDEIKKQLEGELRAMPWIDGGEHRAQQEDEEVVEAEDCLFQAELQFEDIEDKLDFEDELPRGSIVIKNKKTGQGIEGRWSRGQIEGSGPLDPDNDISDEIYRKIDWELRNACDTEVDLGEAVRSRDSHDL
jgi:hypothetical protein